MLVFLRLTGWVMEARFIAAGADSIECGGRVIGGVKISSKPEGGIVSVASLRVNSIVLF